jgi:opacity protein-like surface antigen
MKLSKIALTVIVAAAVATPALRASAGASGNDTGAYLTLDGGANFVQPVTVQSRGSASHSTDIDTGWRVGLIGGYKLNSWAAVELETGFSDNNVHNGDGMWFGSVPVLGNVVFRYENSSKFVPYIGVGAGGAYTMVEGNDTDKTDFVFAYQAKVGVDYEISPCVAVGVGYKFFGTADQKYDEVKIKDIYTHFIGLNLTWKF